MTHSSPIKLKAARAWRTYQGGSQLDKIHGIENSKDTQFPEEWIMSTVTARNPGREDIVEGMCFLEGTDISLKDYIEKYPQEALGKKHIDKWGTTTGVLVKVIDAAERLTVQCHPNKQKAMELFNSKFGKTECWYILGGREIDGEKPSLYFGFKEGIKEEEWVEAFKKQDIPAMLGMLHHFEVKPGDTFLIKGGVPHAIGQGCLLVEIQEPTDYTIRIERITPKGLHVDDRQCHQGLGFDRMFECFDFTGYSQSQAFDNWKIPSKVIEKTPSAVRKEIIGYDSTDCFKMELCEIDGSYSFKKTGIFYGIFILEGEGKLIGSSCEVELKAGDQFFVPASSDDFEIVSKKPVKVFCCFGPKA